MKLYFNIFKKKQTIDEQTKDGDTFVKSREAISTWKMRDILYQYSTSTKTWLANGYIFHKNNDKLISVKNKQEHTMFISASVSPSLHCWYLFSWSSDWLYARVSLCDILNSPIFRLLVFVYQYIRILKVWHYDRNVLWNKYFLFCKTL